MLAGPALALLSTGGAAHADEAPSSAGGAVTPAAMQAEMQRYFDGERQGGLWLMGVGVPMVGFGAGLLALPRALPRAAGGTVLAFGALELAAGTIFFLNSRRRVPHFTRQIVAQPQRYREVEQRRMVMVNSQMRLLESAEINLILAGLAVGTAGALQGQDSLTGFGAGLALHAAILLIYDQLAARRALRYSDALGRFRF